MSSSYFNHTEIISNGFITTIDYSELTINSILLNDGYLNCYQIGDRLSAVNLSGLTNFITYNSLSEAERQDIKTDDENGILYIFTQLVSIAEKLDQFISLISSTSLLTEILQANLKWLQPISISYLDQLLEQPVVIEYQNQRLGQLEWLDYAQFLVESHDYVGAINCYNKYFIETDDCSSGFNLAVLLSKLGLEQQAVDYYLKIQANGYSCEHNLAYSYFQLEQLEAAYTEIQKVDLQSSLKSYLLKAQIEIKLQTYDQALNTLNNGFIATKSVDPGLAQAIKKQFISLNNYLNKVLK